MLIRDESFDRWADGGPFEAKSLLVETANCGKLLSISEFGDVDSRFHDRDCFVIDLGRDGDTPEAQKKAQEGRDPRNEGRIEDGDPPKVTKPGTDKTDD